jgi:hypothetical protein
MLTGQFIKKYKIKLINFLLFLNKKYIKQYNYINIKDVEKLQGDTYQEII